MVLRYRNYQFLLNAVSLCTSLTALFLLVRCSVPERDYADLNIGNSAGSGGSGGSGGDDVIGPAGTGGGGAGGQSGEGGGQSGAGGEAGGAPVPIPCVEDEEDAGAPAPAVLDAGADAGTDDAGAPGPAPAVPDAGSDDEPCACVDGFIQAVDADGDGDRTRACTVAPGLDCDDADDTVTHNSCGGCSALPNPVGEDCLECGTYICDGSDAVACGAKPGPVEDPDCRCEAGLIVARDTDGDGQGTRLCEFRAGTDCNDGDSGFVTNACGGCEALNGTVGGNCGQCGVYACNGNNGLECVPRTGADGQRCTGPNTRQTCVGSGFWQDEAPCPNVCYEGSCQLCTPGTFQCVDLGGGSTQVQICGTDSSSMITWGSYASCVPGETCNPANGACTGSLMWPRDHDFDVAPLLERGGLRWHDVLDRASDADYG